LQNELRETLSLNRDDYRLEVHEGELRTSFIGLQLRSVFQPILDFASSRPLGYEALLRAFDQQGNAVARPPHSGRRKATSACSASCPSW